MSSENEVVNTMGAASAVAEPTKKLASVEFKYGALVTGMDVVYAMSLTAKVVENKKSALGAFGSMFGAGGASEDVEAPEEINTILLASISPDGKVETVEVTEKAGIFQWLNGGKDAKYEIPTYLHEGLRGIVGKDMADFKGKLKTFSPIKDEYIELLKTNALVTEAIAEFEANAISLRDVITESKKSGGNIGLDSFIERYAFNNHILLAGPRGVKFLHDTIAA